MPFKANIVHKRVASAQLGAVQVSLPAAPSFLFLRDVASCILYHIVPLITLQIGMMNECQRTRVDLPEHT
jgi:hypothetical protein